MGNDMKAMDATLPPRADWPKWMTVAAAELGTRETIDRKTDNPRILEYQRATRLAEHALSDETAWCAAFVSWCLEQAGYVNPRYALARNYLKYGALVKTPEFGDILVFSRGSNPRQGHVCFYVRDLGADYEVLGGNQKNSVRFGHENIADLLGIRRPNELAA